MFYWFISINKVLSMIEFWHSIYIWTLNGKHVYKISIGNFSEQLCNLAMIDGCIDAKVGSRILWSLWIYQQGGGRMLFGYYIGKYLAYSLHFWHKSEFCRYDAQFSPHSSQVQFPAKYNDEDLITSHIWKWSKSLSFQFARNCTILNRILCHTYIL